MTRAGRRRLILAAVAIIATVLTLSFVWLDDPPLPEGFAAANGRLEATRVDVATKRAGRLSEVAVREGDIVHREQSVARMDVDALEAELRLAQAELEESVQARSAAEARLVQQESAVEFAAAEFQRRDNLAKQKLVPQQEVDLARSRLDSEMAGVNAARAAVHQSEAAVKAAQAKIDFVQTELDDSILKSPIVGRVLYRLAEPGEVLPVGGKVLTLVDLTDVYMTIFLPTEQAGRVRVGSDARIVLDTRPDVPLTARISFVSPEAQFTPKQVETESERAKLMFRVKARVDPELLMKHFDTVQTGLPGVVYVRLDPDTVWPDELQGPSTTRTDS